MITITINGYKAANGLRELRASEMQDLASRLRKILKRNMFTGKVRPSGQKIVVTSLMAPGFGLKNPFTKDDREEFAQVLKNYFRLNTPLLDVTVRVD